MPNKCKIDYKYKLLTKDALIISLDRLSRFKHPDFVYERVFKDIIHKCCLEPHFSDREIDLYPKAEIAEYCAEIWNKSIYELFGNEIYDKECDFVLKYLSTSCFDVTDENTKILMNKQLKFSALLKDIDTLDLPLNLQFLKKIYEELKIGKTVSEALFEELREKHGLLFPIKKLVIVEGITEDILLPVFAKKLNKTFEKLGIFVLSAGGKTKIPVLYGSMKDSLKIPAILIFDEDAKEICANIKQSILPKDKMQLNTKGEFEDLLSLNLIKRTLNNFYYNSEDVLLEDLKQNSSMCQNLEEYFRLRNLGEFKKAHFAKLISENIKYKTDISEEIEKLISDIVNF